MVALAIAVLAARIAHQSGMRALAAEADRALDLIVANLEGELARYESMPRLLALDPRFDRFLQQGAPDDEAESVNRLLVQVNQVTGALDTYLLDRQGLTVAASNWRAEKPFVGQNFSYRPYFQEAMQGRASRYFALGTTSNRRGYYFAFPVMGDGEPQGAIVVKAAVEHLETYWSSGGRRVVVLDENGIVFLSSQPEWWFRSMAPLEANARLRLADTRRYGDDPIEVVALARTPVYGLGSVVRFDANPDDGSGGRRWLERSREMRDAGWTVTLLTDVAPAERAARWAGALAALLSLFVLAVAILLIERRTRIRREAETARRARELLEERVQARTRALAEANAELRRTRADLLRQERLAALGQVSAGIGHELTQPLTAIHGYVQNALGFLARGRLENVRSNLERIDTLGTRIDEVVRHLKTLVRGEPPPIEVVDANALVRDVIEDARSSGLLAGVEVRVPDEDTELLVVASAIGLRQVFTNLISNALDAVRGREGARISIEASAAGEQVEFVVSDNGAGFGDAEPESVFRAFFTTKGGDRGMGLGLAIVRSSLAQMGAHIEAEHGRPGARFRFSLMRRPGAGAGHAGAQSAHGETATTTGAR